MLSVMPFTAPKYDKNTVDLAGDALIGNNQAITVLEDSGLDVQEVIYDWRSAHAYPLVTFYNTLGNRAISIDGTAIVAQRRKRLSSIKDKLERYDWLKLSEMQDIAGCRAIVGSVGTVYNLVERYKRKYSTHILDDEKDYIRNPKGDGYRSYHLIYRYSNAKQPQYEGLKVEMQFRSELQHCWATAVETADIFYREGLKAHRGSPEWRRFFALMGAAMAMRERERHVPHTPRNWDELISELRHSASNLDIKARLSAFGRTLNVIGEADTRRAGIKYVVLLLNPAEGNEELQLFGFGASNIQEAAERLESEEQFKTEGSDAVLVSVSDAGHMRRAYPNYFLDTTLFLNMLDEFTSGESRP